MAQASLCLPNDKAAIFDVRPPDIGATCGDEEPEIATSTSKTKYVPFVVPVAIRSEEWDDGLFQLGATLGKQRPKH